MLPFTNGKRSARRKEKPTTGEKEGEGPAAAGGVAFRSSRFWGTI